MSSEESTAVGKATKEGRMDKCFIWLEFIPGRNNSRVQQAIAMRDFWG